MSGGLEKRTTEKMKLLPVYQLPLSRRRKRANEKRRQMLLLNCKLDTNICSLNMRVVNTVGKVWDPQGPLGSTKAITNMIAYNQHNASECLWTLIRGVRNIYRLLV